MELDAAARGKRRVQRKILDPIVQDIMTEAAKGKPKRQPKKPKVASTAMLSKLADLSTYKDYFKVVF
jgi:hypothetical protein